MCTIQRKVDIFNIFGDRQMKYNTTTVNMPCLKPALYRMATDNYMSIGE